MKSQMRTDVDAADPVSSQQVSEPGSDDRTRKLLNEHHRLNIRIEELEHELDCLHSSLSWRITAPLRNLKPAIGYLMSLGFRRQHKMSLNPFCNLVHKGEFYLVSGVAPYFILHSNKRRLPCRWVEISIKDADESKLRSFILYADSGQGFSEERCWQLDLCPGSPRIINLPGLVRTLRLDPLFEQRQFSMPVLEFKELSSTGFYLRRLLEQLSERGGASKLLSGLLNGGIIALRHLLLQYDLRSSERNRAYQHWIKSCESVQQQRQGKQAQRVAALRKKPLISILMPVYNTPEKWLRKALDSVLLQSYSNWELCIADDASTRPGVRAVLEEYRARDERIQVSYRPDNGHISASSNSALDMASGEYVALMDHDDELPSYALLRVVEELNMNSELDLIFSDEDRVSKAGERLDPYFKSGWSYPQFLSQNIISHLGVYRTEIARSVRFRIGYEGSQDWDFALRFIEAISVDRIAHIPEVLYHWRMIPGTVSFTSETKVDAFRTAVAAVQESLDRRGIAGVAGANKEGRIQITPALSAKPGVSLFTPARTEDLLNLIKKRGDCQIAVISLPGVTPLSADQQASLTGSLELFNCGVVGVRSVGADGLTRSCGVDIAHNGSQRRIFHGLPQRSPGQFGLACVAREVMSVDEAVFAFSTDLLAELDVNRYALNTGEFEVLLRQLVLELSAVAWRRSAHGKLDSGVIVRSDLQVSVIASGQAFEVLPQLRSEDMKILIDVSRRFQSSNLSTLTPDYFFSFSPGV